ASTANGGRRAGSHRSLVHRFQETDEEGKTDPMTDLVVFTNWAWMLGAAGLGIALFIYGYVKKQPAGNEVMVDLGEQIHDGAMAFLKREYSVLAVFVVVVAVLLSLAIGTLPA